MKTFDFTTFQEPSIEVKLGKKGDTPTVIHVQVVDTKLMKRLMAAAEQLKDVENDDDDKVEGVFRIIAGILSHNEEERTFTTDDLRNVYGMKFVAAVNFMSAYMDFVSEIVKEKN